MKKITHSIIAASFLFLVFCFSATAQTNVSGGIYANTTWTLANSPYIVVDTVVVFPGVTLTIEPGVTVKFADNMQIEIRQANIISIGTITDSITYTSNSASPTPGIYTGLYLNGGNMTSIFNYCNFKYAGSAINNQAADTVISKNSNFVYNTFGIGANTGVVLIDTCNFSNNDGGLYLVSSSTINYCNFLFNSVGLESDYHSMVKNCFFNSNQTGLSISYMTVNDCRINHNQNGIMGQGENTIKNSIIDSNNLTGIFVIGDSVIN